MNNPKFVKIHNELYKINTSYKVALQCNEITKDNTISVYERALAIIYKLFGDKGLYADNEIQTKLLEASKTYLSCGQTKHIDDNKKPDMDYNKDLDLIETSFLSDYGIKDLKDMHWWTFYKLVNGLSNSELGNCCIFNRVRNLRNYDLSQIKDAKIRDEIKKAQEFVALDDVETEINYTPEEQNAIDEFNRNAGII